MDGSNINNMIGICLAALIFWTTLARPTYAVDISQCIAPLGMEQGLIRDEDITASSSFDSGNVGPQHGRMRTETHGGAWCPKHQITSDPNEWLEVDLHAVHMVTSTGTQGRFGNGQGQEFAEDYLLEYWRPRLGKWVQYRNFKGEEKITGNTNTYLESKQELEPPIWASKIRFLPYSYHRRTVCMRVEIYGCYWNDGVVSYSMPQGDKRGASWELFDTTYDGHWDGELRRGLGLLTDGKVGADNFKTAYYDYGKGHGWVGWRNDSRQGQAIKITFEFDRVREFTAVHIYCNNQFTRDVQVFSEANILFSVGGIHYVGEPISYSYIEDRIFEYSRNVSIKLHHRIGRFAQMELQFAAKWIMISEVTFDSDIAHGNFTAETPTSKGIPIQSDVFIENSRSEFPAFTAKHEDPTYKAIIIGVLTTVTILLVTSMLFIINRLRHRKYFAGVFTSKSVLPCNHLPSGSSCGGTNDKNNYKVSYDISELDFNRKCGDMATLPVATPCGDKTHQALDYKLDDYQEPYHASKYAPYYSYSAVVMEMTDDTMLAFPNPSDASNYDYAAPEPGNVPLLSTKQGSPQPISCSDQSCSLSQNSSKGYGNEGKMSSNRHEVLSNALQERLQQTIVPEFPRHRLRMLTKLAEGAFGTVYVAEAEGIPEYGSAPSLGLRLVAVKFLLQDASDKEKIDFHRDVLILSALEDANISRVLGVCSCDDPLSVILEYLDHGDLCQFLKTHVPAGTKSLPSSAKTLSFNCLLYMATQIASGMKYLESLNFVHRDLATRNCLIGRSYQIKISDVGTDNEQYSKDYYKVDGNIRLPVRWMSWESIFRGKYTTKSDVWSFGVTFAEILSLGRRRPFEELNDSQVVEHLSLMVKNQISSVLPVDISRSYCTPKDINDLMIECWKRNNIDRPTFREIHLFLQRKNLGYAPVS